MNQIATISNEGAVHFLTYKDDDDGGASLSRSWSRLLSEYEPGKVFPIVDRLKAHEAKAVADWVAEHRDRIELFFPAAVLPRVEC